MSVLSVCLLSRYIHNYVTYKNIHIGLLTLKVTECYLAVNINVELIAEKRLKTS